MLFLYIGNIDGEAPLVANIGASQDIISFENRTLCAGVHQKKLSEELKNNLKTATLYLQVLGSASLESSLILGLQLSDNGMTIARTSGPRMHPDAARSRPISV